MGQAGRRPLHRTTPVRLSVRPAGCSTATRSTFRSPMGPRALLPHPRALIRRHRRAVAVDRPQRSHDQTRSGLGEVRFPHHCTLLGAVMIIGSPLIYQEFNGGDPHRVWIARFAFTAQFLGGLGRSSSGPDVCPAGRAMRMTEWLATPASSDRRALRSRRRASPATHCRARPSPR